MHRHRQYEREEGLFSGFFHLCCHLEYLFVVQVFAAIHILVIFELRVQLFNAISRVHLILLPEGGRRRHNDMRIFHAPCFHQRRRQAAECFVLGNIDGYLRLQW